MTANEPTVFVALPTNLRERFFPSEVREQLEAIAAVRWHDGESHPSAEELADQLPGVDVLVTGWGAPTLTDTVLANADALGLVFHTGGSVASYVTEAVYDRGISVCSANRPMARYVAEFTLAHMTAAQRDVVRAHETIRGGGYDRTRPGRTLLGASVGLVGLGTVGRYLLPLLAPFDVNVELFDPYVPAADVTEYDFVSKATLEDALEGSDVVSIHAARTPETRGMIGADELALLPDGALLVNTARAEIVDEGALLAELGDGRIRAALDVYHEEPLPAESQLRELDNVQLTPHAAGRGPNDAFGATAVREIERYREDQALQHEIPREQADLMTR